MTVLVNSSGFKREESLHPATHGVFPKDGLRGYNSDFPFHRVASHQGVGHWFEIRTAKGSVVFCGLLMTFSYRTHGLFKNRKRSIWLFDGFYFCFALHSQSMLGLEFSVFCPICNCVYIHTHTFSFKSAHTFSFKSCWVCLWPTVVLGGDVNLVI